MYLGGVCLFEMASVWKGQWFHCGLKLLACRMSFGMVEYVCIFKCDCACTYLDIYIHAYIHTYIHTYMHTYTRNSCCSGTSRFYLVPCSQTAFETKTKEFEFQTDQSTEALSFVKGHFALSAQLRAEGVCQSEIPDWSVVFSRHFPTFQVFFGYINMFQKSRNIVINHGLHQKVTSFHLQNWCNTKIHHLKSVCGPSKKVISDMTLVVFF